MKKQVNDSSYTTSRDTTCDKNRRFWCSVPHLRDCLHVDIGTLSPLFERMEQAGFLTRRRDPEDERRVLVALTPRRRAIRAEAKAIPEALAQRNGLKNEDVMDIRDRTRELVDRLAALIPSTHRPDRP
jgi:MarR family transcriptional regulator, organic hydroperoxide resistance regulator